MLLSTAKKREEKEQTEIAKRLVNLTDEVVNLLSEKQVQMYECKIIHRLLGERFQSMINNFVDQKYLNHIKQNIDTSEVKEEAKEEPKEEVKPE